LVPCLSLLLLQAGAQAQRLGDASFRVFQRGSLIGSAASSLSRDEGGWVLQGTSELEGVRFSVKRLIVRYDDLWHPRDMSMELVTPEDHMIVHVAFGLADGATRTDIVRAGEAVYGSNRVAPDTLVLPDMVFSAYEALAARLATAKPGTELKAFIVARAEVPVALDGVLTETVATRTGTVAAAHWHIRLLQPEGARPADVWITEGRLARLDLPREGLSIVRDDLAWGAP
jgi:hypothetical protein